MQNIYSLNPNKSVGPNNIRTRIEPLKNDISGQLTYVFNSFFSAGIFPKVPKVPNVIPVQKEDSKSDVSNYRPISLSSNIENIIGKINIL